MVGTFTRSRNVDPPRDLNGAGLPSHTGALHIPRLLRADVEDHVVRQQVVSRIGKEQTVESISTSRVVHVPATERE